MNLLSTLNSGIKLLGILSEILRHLKRNTGTLVSCTECYIQGSEDKVQISIIEVGIQVQRLFGIL